LQIEWIIWTISGAHISYWKKRPIQEPQTGGVTMVQQLRKSITTLIFFAISATAFAQAPSAPLTLRPDAPDRYVVVPGDTLWGISQRYTDSPWRWPELWGLNKEQIRNPHLIYPGYVILLDRARGQAHHRRPHGSGGSRTDGAARRAAWLGHARDRLLPREFGANARAELDRARAALLAAPSVREPPSRAVADGELAASPVEQDYVTGVDKVGIADLLLVQAPEFRPAPRRVGYSAAKSPQVSPEPQRSGRGRRGEASGGALGAWANAVAEIAKKMSVVIDLRNCWTHGDPARLRLWIGRFFQ